VKTSERSSKLPQHLHTYALAASAAGVSMLALAQPGEAEIIYTPADASIGRQVYYLDVTGDGTTDFYFVDRYRTSTFITWDTLWAGPNQAGNEIDIGPLRAGSIISDADFSSKGGAGTMAHGIVIRTTHRAKSHCYGSWKNKKNHYLGLQFMISGEVHYGWARFSVSCEGFVVNGELTGYAYETIPNKGIVAGKKKGKLEDESLTGPDEATPLSVPAPTATLGMLAGGAQALSIWRRE
jgi:hypothetical protein